MANKDGKQDTPGVPALPAAYLARMESQYGEDFPAFLAAMREPPYRGIRRNPLKCDEKTLFAALPFAPMPSPFSPFGYYAPTDFRPGTLPAHHAGLFYMQEPSAGSAVTLLDPQPGEKILDLCAAPGGKSTQIAGILAGKGLLLSNETVSSRCGVLCSNLERFGVRNAIVTNCRPDLLASVLPGYFDKVLVDAPCSGEGMFRRDPASIAEWTPAAPAACAARQREILSSAAALVRPGGILVYSTCTFSREENEDTVTRFLTDHPEFSPMQTGVSFGKPVLDGSAVRIDPLCGGEGHFAAKLQKAEGDVLPPLPPFRPSPLPSGLSKMAKELYTDCFLSPLPSSSAFYFLPAGGVPGGVSGTHGGTHGKIHGGGTDRRKGGDRTKLPEEGKLLLLPAPPEELPDLSGVPLFKMGVEFALLKGDRLEPCHGIFLAAGSRCRRTLSLAPDDPRLAAFLRGEELPCDPALRGWTAVCMDGIPVGFGKASEGRLKNRYPKGLRNHT